MLKALNIHWKDWCWSWSSSTLATWCKELTHWKISLDDAGKDWGQKENRGTEDEMIGWHYQLNGHEFEQGLGDSEGQGSLACCSREYGFSLQGNKLMCFQLWFSVYSLFLAPDHLTFASSFKWTFPMCLSRFPQNFLGIIRESFFWLSRQVLWWCSCFHFFGLCLNFMFKFLFHCSDLLLLVDVHPTFCKQGFCVWATTHRTQKDDCWCLLDIWNRG